MKADDFCLISPNMVWRDISTLKRYSSTTVQRITHGACILFCTVNGLLGDLGIDDLLAKLVFLNKRTFLFFIEKKRLDSFYNEVKNINAVKV